MAVVFKLGFKIVPDPESKVQTPVPTEVVLAAIVAVVAQTDCEGPAKAGVGGASFVTVTDETELIHAPFDVVH